MELMEHQLEAAKKLSSGKVLYGGVGSGKTAAVLAYYVDNEEWRNIYVITTARKRDSGDWEDEAAKFGIGTGLSCYGRLTVDSWNNIDKYTDVVDAFFVFDEQRVVGNGSWVKAFLKIAANGNHWVLLSATPGDTWMDYAPVFIANGYFASRKEFVRKHVVYKHYLKYPVVDHYFNEEKLEEYRNEVLIEMPYFRLTERVLNWWDVGYDKAALKRVQKDRWNIYKDEPIKNVPELFYVMRKVVNSDPSRMQALRKLHKLHPKLIVFYNFDYELEILRTMWGETNVFEWNGHRKNKLEDFQELDRWLYLVQYTSGAEAWNCTATDAMVLYSLNYSYKIFEQVQGRIDRMDTKFRDLYYYIFVSNSPIDRAIRFAIESKQAFNERKALKQVTELERFEPDIWDPFEAKLEAKWGHVEDDFVEVCQI